MTDILSNSAPCHNCFFNIFPIIIIFRFAQMLWLSGIADAAYQTMFSAVPPEKRDQVNAFLNGVPEQAGVFLAGGILIIGETSFNLFVFIPRIICGINPTVVQIAAIVPSICHIIFF